MESNYIPSELEHKAAYRYFCLENIWYEDLLGVMLDRDPKTPKYKENIEDFLKKLDRLYQKWDEQGEQDKELWEINSHWSYEEFKKQMMENLNDQHCGDCVNIPMTCPKCYTESLYEIESTIPKKQ